jgi:hypothetical protein
MCVLSYPLLHVNYVMCASRLRNCCTFLEREQFSFSNCFFTELKKRGPTGFKICVFLFLFSLLIKQAKSLFFKKLAKVYFLKN